MVVCMEVGVIPDLTVVVSATSEIQWNVTACASGQRLHCHCPLLFKICNIQPDIANVQQQQAKQRELCLFIEIEHVYFFTVMHANKYCL